MGLRSRNARSRFTTQSGLAPAQVNGVNDLAAIGSRCVLGESKGQPTLHLVFVDAAGQDRIDVSFLLRAPALAEAFSEALLRKLAIDRQESRNTFTKWLRLGFFRYLAESGQEGVGLMGLEAPIFQDFIVWLDRSNPKTGASVWSQGTRSSYLHAIRGTVDVLRGLPKWSRLLSSRCSVPTHQWIGAKRRHVPTEILDDDHAASIYRACLAEIVKTREAVERDWLLVEGATSSLPKDPVTFRVYDSRQVTLSALAEFMQLGLPVYPDLQRKNGALLRAIKLNFGSLVEFRLALAPGPRHLVPFILMLAFHTRLNPETLLGSCVDDFYKQEFMGVQRFFSRHYKGRSRRTQRPSTPVEDVVDNPAAIYDFVLKWTSRLRTAAHASMASHLFLYLPRTSNGSVSFFDVYSPNGSRFSPLLDEFCRDHGLRRFTLRQIRSTVLDAGRSLFGGDVMVASALADHRSLETTQSHYTSDAQRRRNEERLGDVFAARERWIESNGNVDIRGREPGADIGSATPGWRCLDPYASPFSQNGKLCVAYGRCPVCPMAHLDLASPISLGLVLRLLEAVRRAKGTLDPQGWVERMAPIESRILSYWIPLFSEQVIEEAQALSLQELPTPE